jgi:hypothetical protein
VTTVGFEGFEGGEPGARSQRPALNQCGSTVFAAISFRTRVARLHAQSRKFLRELPRAIQQRATIRRYRPGSGFSDAISRRVLLDTASLVEGNNIVPLPRVARE